MDLWVWSRTMPFFQAVPTHGQSRLIMRRGMKHSLTTTKRSSMWLRTHFRKHSITLMSLWQISLPLKQVVAMITWWRRTSRELSHAIDSQLLLDITYGVSKNYHWQFRLATLVPASWLSPSNWGNLSLTSLSVSPQYCQPSQTQQTPWSIFSTRPMTILSQMRLSFLIRWTSPSMMSPSHLRFSWSSTMTWSACKKREIDHASGLWLGTTISSFSWKDAPKRGLLGQIGA